MNRHPYPAYKPSGADWLGEIPAHWELLQIKRLSPVKRGASPRPIDDPNYFDDKGEYSWVRISDVTSSKRYLEETTQRLSSLGKSLSVPLKPGALFLSIAGSVGKPIITRINCCIHDGFVYFPQFEGNPEFLYYIFASGQPYGGLGKLGTQLNLNTDTVGAIHIGYPSYEEQGKIVAYLDHETTRIDTLIEKKQKQIELLQEKRTALISHAVTKGLGPNAKMKDSGIEWLGKIPAHWEVKRTKMLLSRNEGGVWGKDFDDKGVVILRSTEQTIDGEWNIVEPAKRRITPSEYNTYRLMEGDLVVTKSSGSALHIGKTSIVTKDVEALNCCYSNFMQRLRVKQDIMPRYAWYVLNGEVGRKQFDYFSTTTTGLANLNGGIIGMVSLAFPSLLEQCAVITFLNRETARIDALIEKVEKSIILLREYRTSLISAAVTGKIDVRKEAA